MTAPRPVVAVVGDVGLDVVVRTAGPRAIGSDTRSDVRLTHGGAGGNTAAWLAGLDAEAVLVGRIGQDDAGTLVRAELDRSGVRPALAVDRDLPTCCVVVLVEADGVRTMLPGRGASGALEPADVLGADLDRVQHVHVSGYVLLDASTRAAGLAALALARERGLTTSVDPQASALLVDVPQFLADVDGVDVLLPNEDELIALTGPTAGSGLARRLGPVPARPGRRRRGDQRRARCDVGRPPAVGHGPAPCRPTVVDPTGAGDAFDAGLLAAWLAGASAEHALSAGVRAGAAAVSRVGARPHR